MLRQAAPSAKIRRILYSAAASNRGRGSTMGALAAAVRTRHSLHSRILQARSRTDELFGIVRQEALYDRPIPERHRVVFYLGHVEAFDWNLLAQRAFGLKAFHPQFDRLFAFGIDPTGASLPNDAPEDWPRRGEVEQYNRKVRELLDRAIEDALEHPNEGHRSEEHTSELQSHVNLVCRLLLEKKNKKQRRR